jgi:hypothetical protein
MSPPFSVSGQIITRDKGEAPDGSGRDLIMVMGVIAVPKGSFKPEHQYTVFSNAADCLFVHPAGVDLTDMIRGWDAGSIFCHPLWRV